MKIVSWNCCWQKGGFTPQKQDKILALGPDILVVQECKKEDWERLGYTKEHGSWYGDGLEAAGDFKKNLGIGVFCKDGITIAQLPEWENSLSKNPNFRYLIPYRVEGDFEPFTLIAVWTKNKMDASDPLDYVQKAHAAIDRYSEIGLLNDRIILIGDFNSNKIWDACYREDWNHSAMVDKLCKKGIKNCSKSTEDNDSSTYHYFSKDQDRQVIDDYCFASVKLADCANVLVPGAGEWISGENGRKYWCGLSDHCPIIVDFDL